MTDRNPFETVKRKRRTAKHREAIYVAHDWICHLCKTRIDPTHDRHELDHVTPLWCGGTDDDDNLAPAHSRCHLEKSTGDLGTKAKRDRIRAFDLGIKRSSRPMPCGKRSPWKRKFSGEIVPR